MATREAVAIMESGDQMTQLTDVVCLLVLEEDDEEVFLGSTFPVNERHRLYPWGLLIQYRKEEMMTFESWLSWIQVSKSPG